MLGRELLTPDEARKLDNKKCLIFIRGFDPILDNKYVPSAHPAFNQTADGKGEVYEHRISKEGSLIGPPFELLSSKAVKYYEQLKEKGGNVYIDHVTYEEFMLLGDQELRKRFLSMDESMQKECMNRERVVELEYSENDRTEQRKQKKIRRPLLKGEDTITNRMLSWKYSQAQKEQLKLAISAGIPKKELLSYFYPDIPAEQMRKIRADYEADH